VTAFADQVHDGPVLLSLLQVLHRQVNQFRASQTAAEEQCEHCMISLATDRAPGRNAQQRHSLLRGKPVPETDSQFLGALHPTNARGEFWAQQAAISRFVCETTNRG
jgi:hypothetical protein